MKQVLVLVVFLLFACQFIKEKKPQTVIPEDKFIILLADYHLAQGIATTSTFAKKTKNVGHISVTDSIIKKYGYSKAQFDSTISWYSADPDKFEAIYDKVITRLSRMQAEVQEKMARSGEIKRQDTTNAKAEKPKQIKEFNILDKNFFENAKNKRKAKKLTKE
jgi:hypothetical protein